MLPSALLGGKVDDFSIMITGCWLAVVSALCCCRCSVVVVWCEGGLAGLLRVLEPI